jgi:hypothetical protein
LTLSATARSSVCVPMLVDSYVWTWVSSILLTLPLLTRLTISTSPKSATPLYAESGLLGDSSTPRVTFGDCGGPKNVRSFGDIDCVDLALGEAGSFTRVRSFALPFPGTDGGGFLPSCSGRELVMDLSLDTKDNMFRGIA